MQYNDHNIDFICDKNIDLGVQLKIRSLAPEQKRAVYDGKQFFHFF